MEQAALELAKQIPSLVVLVWLVVHFLRAQEKRDKMIEGLAAQCHVQQAAAAAVIVKNSETLGRIESQLDRHPEAITVAVRDGINQSKFAA